MNKNFICHYSVLRFCPYQETEEFINVGILLSCPETGFLDYKLEKKKWGRISKFFPELDSDIFRAGIASVKELLDISVPNQKQNTPAQLAHDLERNIVRNVFNSLVRPRETIFYFSDVRVMSTQSPVSALQELFTAYIDRQFAKSREYQEVIMQKRLKQLLADNNLEDRFTKNHFVGDALFKVRIPFVAFGDVSTNIPKIAIKPLNLDRTEPTDIIRHGDSWKSNVIRLRAYNTAPGEMLFTIRKPSKNTARHDQAYQTIISDFEDNGIDFLEESDHQHVLAFARRVMV